MQNKSLSKQWWQNRVEAGQQRKLNNKHDLFLYYTRTVYENRLYYL